MQARLAKNGFSNTMSGQMNAKNCEQSKKLIDLGNFDVQMLSPDFLLSKTLKKPIKQSEIHLQKTNPYGTQFHIPQSDRPFPSTFVENTSFRNIKTNKKQISQSLPMQNQYKYVSAQNLNIKPAYRSKQPQKIATNPSMQLLFKDKNSIISALLKKGQLNKDIPYQIKVIKPEPVEAATKKTGPAQTKLKSLFNKKQNNFVTQINKNKFKDAKSSQEQQLHQQIQQDYGIQSFEKMSGAYQSQIKQSIKQSIGASSGIKESIRQSIGGSQQKIKQSIRQSIKQSLRQQIQQSIRSNQSKSIEEIKQELVKQNIEEQVYEQIFEQASFSDQISKSKSNSKPFKKSKQQDKLDLSASASKKFRTKTNLITKSIKFAQQLTIHQSSKNIDEKFQQKVQKGDKLAEQIIKQRTKLQKLQQKITAFLNTDSDKNKKQYHNKNSDLFFKFRIEINRLITSQNFMSKFRKLTAFIGNSPSSKLGDLSNLQDKLLGNLMQRINDLRVSGVTKAQLDNMKKQYDQKLVNLLEQQEISLKIQMDRKLHQKDMQLKKIIAELQQKFRTTIPTSYISQQGPKRPTFTDRVEVDSDYSIQSDQISWKMDLWEVLPDYEKKKLYEKQGNQVTKFLTDVLMKEIQNQNLNRSADISFQFPDQLNTSNQSTNKSNQPKFAKSSNQYNEPMMKSAIDRQQLRKQLNKHPEKSQIFPPLSGVKKQQNTHDQFQFNIHFLDAPGRPTQDQRRQTLSASEVIKILSKYKTLMLKKKNQLIKKLIKILQTKTQPIISLINQLRILNEKQYTTVDAPFIKAYEEDIIMQLIAIYNKCKNRKTNYIEEQMKKMYDRLVVTCQVKTAEASIGRTSQIIPNQNYMNFIMSQQDKKVKDIITNQILNILTAQFAKQMPRNRK